MGKSVCLSIEGNCVEGRHSIIMDNKEMKVEVELPDVCQLFGACTASVQRAIKGLFPTRLMSQRKKLS